MVSKEVSAELRRDDGPLTREDVVSGFRWILGREPESEATIQAHLGLRSTKALRRALMDSAEFAAALESKSAVSPEDVALFQKYQSAAAGRPGFVVDFLGTATSIDFNNAIRAMSGVVEGIPVRGNFHSGPVEWIGLLRAVDSAGAQFNMAEFGAGWAPWLVAGAAAARKRGITSIKLAGVEADEGHFGFMQEHLASNGLVQSQLELFKGAVAVADGTVMFPEIDSREDWGAAATAHAGPVDYRGKPLRFREVAAFSPETVLTGASIWDLCHVDIQGAERDVICGSLETFSKKVRWMIVGTHSRSIEGTLFDALSGAGWQLELEEPCQFQPGPPGKKIDEAETSKDGTQVWRNPRLAR